MENQLKNTIKEMSAEQTTLKPQRKEVHFEGDRKLSPAEAVVRHLTNRQQLRLMYIAYAILREKDPVEAVGNYDPKDPYQVRAVQKYVDQHADFFKQRKAKWETANALYQASK